MARVESFRDLLVWQRAMTLATRCYQVSKGFHNSDQFSLGDQLRRSAVSVPSNIAEGFGRYHTASYVQFLRIANGSNNELQTQIELGQRLGIICANDAESLMGEAREIGRMLQGLMRSLKAT